MLNVLKQGGELQQLLDAVVVVAVHLVGQLLQPIVDDRELFDCFAVLIHHLSVYRNRNC